MKLLPESPVAFRAPLSKPPDTLFITRIEGLVDFVLAGTDDALVFVRRDVTLDDFSHDLSIQWGIRTIYDDTPLKRPIEQFERYLAGDRRPFSAAVQPFGVSAFTFDVHRFLTRIPFGAVMSYGEVAEGMGHPLASRAVGTACGKNRILIAIPCHRVVASNGIGGFGAGLHIKKRLLSFEGIDRYS